MVSLLIAQMNQSQVWQKAQPILLIGLGLILGAILFGVLMAWWRRRSLIDEPSSSEAWTLEDLRRMRTEGSLTEDEYQRIRAAMIAGYKERAREGEKADSSAGKGV